MSKLDEMKPGTYFHPVLGDTDITNTDGVKRVVFCSGKYYYNLTKERERKNVIDTALIRLEV